jgi:hypothetical protein
MKRWLILPVLGAACLCLAGSAYQDDRKGDGPPGRGPRPVGTWEQTADNHQITLRVEPDRLHVSVAPKGGKPAWVLDADYGVTKDSIVFGIVTSVEGAKSVVRAERQEEPAFGPGGPLPPGVGGPGPGAPPGPGGRPFPPGGPPPGIGPGGDRGPAAGPAALDIAIDDLFSFRFRVDDDILTIKEMKLKGGAARGDLVLQGRFKRVEEARPKEDIPKAEFKKDERK